MKENRRLKNITDKFLLYIAEKLDKNINKSFQYEDIKEIYNEFEDYCKDLQKINEDFTEEKLRLTGEIIVNETLKELGLDKNTISCNKVQSIACDLFNNMIDNTKEDFYKLAVESICILGALCKLYIDNIGNTNTIDFKEVEEKYE